MAKIRPATRLRAQPALVAGGANRVVVGSNAAQAQPAEVAGVGVRVLVGSGVAQSQDAQASGLGALSRVGAGSLISQDSRVVGTGSGVIPPSPEAEADWQARIGQRGVLWHHDFRNQAEVDNFRASNNVSDPNDTVNTSRHPGSVVWHTSESITGGACLRITRNAGTQDGKSWWRPLSPLQSPGNGKATNDPGIGGSIPAEAWNPVQGSSSALSGWTKGYYGVTDNHGTGDFDGQSYFLQVQIKMTADLYGEPRGGKTFFFTTTQGANVAQQIYTPAVEYGAGSPQGTNVNFLSFARTGGVPISQDIPGGINQPGSDFGVCDWSVAAAGCWQYSNQWDQMLFQIVPGISGNNDTVLRCWVAYDGADTYVKVWDMYQVDLPYEGVHGHNAFIVSGFLNGLDYSKDITRLFDQIICSTEPVLTRLDTPTNLERRCRDLVPANTPVSGANYFKSGDGQPFEVANNNAPGQSNNITWQVEGAYYDPLRRKIHQLDRQHGSENFEHSTYDELTNSWVATPILPDMDTAPPGHWRGASFDPVSGRLFWQREGTNKLYIYDFENGWSTTTHANLAGSARAYAAGYHPHLFGANREGVLCTAQNYICAYNLNDGTWRDLTAFMGGGADLVDLERCQGIYFPFSNELMITGNARDNPNSVGNNIAIVFPAGVGNLSNISLSTPGVELRNTPPKAITGDGGYNKLYACFHPQQPNVLLGFDPSNTNVWYTDDAGVTPWKAAGFTHPFLAEFSRLDRMTVGSMTHHGVVAGCEHIGPDLVQFLYWKPPLVP